MTNDPNAMISAPVTQTQEHANALDALDWFAHNTPDRTALVFLGDGEHESDTLTYSDLWRRSRSVAWALRAAAPSYDGMSARALLCFPPGLEFVVAFVACLYAKITAVPLYAPHPRRADDRFESVPADCYPQFILTDAGTVRRSSLLFERLAVRYGAMLIATDEVRLDNRECIEALTTTSGLTDIAFIQYTSGSTASPRGVLITHGNLAANSQMICRAMRLCDKSVVVSWLPMHHDMGLIGDTLQPLAVGATAVKMPPACFLQRPQRWLEAVTKYRGTVIGGPTFAYDLCNQLIRDEDITALDLSSVTVAYCGSEPIRAETLERFVERFAACGLDATSLFPCYGLAEATLFVTGGPIGRVLKTTTCVGRHIRRPFDPGAADHRRIVSCGPVPPELHVAIVDADTPQPTDEGQAGEVCISGPSVSSGYWGRDNDVSEDVCTTVRVGDRTYLRTGDIGYFMEGELYVAGRLKDVIIVRGCNHFPQDIENTAKRTHTLLQAGVGAAFAIDDDNDTKVVLVHEVRCRMVSPLVHEAHDAVFRAISSLHRLSVQDIVFVRLGTIPITSSGKVRRRRCRELYVSGELQAILRTSNALGYGVLRGGV